MSRLKTIASQRRTISASAIPGMREPKKMPDQATFRASCAKKISNAGNAPRWYSRQTSHAEIAIRTYSAVQTGPKTQLGGVPGGLRSFGYQSRTLLAVKNEPRPPAPRQTAKKRISTSQGWASTE